MTSCDHKTDHNCAILNRHVNDRFCQVECAGDPAGRQIGRFLQAPAQDPPGAAGNFHAGCPFHKLPCNRCLLDYQSDQLPGRCLNTDLVSVIILARAEPYLNQTLTGLEATARGQIEFIVVAEGPLLAPLPQLKTPVTLIEHDQPIGRRPSSNEAADAAIGKYLFHVDAHVKTDTIGWDVLLRNACSDNHTLVIPSLDKLNVDTWTNKGRRQGHKYISTRLRDEWSDVKPRQPVEETVTGNGMGWFLTADYYWALGGCDETLAAIWGSFGVEWALKVWLSDPDGRGPGRVLLHRDVVFGHWWKGSLPYSTPGVHETRERLRVWEAGAGPRQVRPISFLYDRLPQLFPANQPLHKMPLAPQRPPVTVIMNTNGLYPALIEEAIESFLRQDYPNKHLLIVNTHPTPLQIDTRAKNIEIQNIPPFGSFPEQIAFAIKQVKTDYWCVMDTDDIFYSYHLTQLVDGMLKARADGLNPPCYVVNPQSYESKGDNPPYIRTQLGWWCCLYTRLEPQQVDAVLAEFQRVNGKDTGFDWHLVRFTKLIGWNQQKLPGVNISVLHRLKVGFHIRRAADNAGHYAEGVARSRREPLPRLRPHWRRDYQIDQRAGFTIKAKCHLGDCIAMEPALRSLKAKYPDRPITLITRFTELFEYHPSLQAILPLDSPHPAVDYTLRVRRELHISDWLRAEIGLDLDHGQTPPDFSYLVLDDEEHSFDTGDGSSMTVNYSGFADLYDLIDLSKPTVAISGWTKAVHKRWNRDKWRALVAWLHEQGYQTVQLGTNEKEIGCTANLNGQTTILDTASIIKQCVTLISIDHGLSHLAVALGKQPIVLYGPARPDRVAWGDTIALCSDVCSDCDSKVKIGRKCPKGDALCMFDITVDQVKAAFNIYFKTFDPVTTTEYTEHTENENRQCRPSGPEPLTSDAIARRAGYRDYFDYLKKSGRAHHKTYGRWQRDYGRMIDDVFSIRGRQVLDVGCAAGALVKAFIEEAGADAVGCDINGDIIAGSPFRRKRSRLTCVDTCQLTTCYQPQSFDLIHSQQVFEHFPNIYYSMKAVEQIAFLLKPGGLLFVALQLGDHLTVDELLDLHRVGVDIDITHINIWPRDVWHPVFAVAGLVDVTARYRERFNTWRSRRGFSFMAKYRWDYFVLEKPAQPTVGATHASPVIGSREDLYTRSQQTDIHRERAILDGPPCYDNF